MPLGLGMLAAFGAVVTASGGSPAPLLVMPLALLVVAGCYAFSPRAVRVTSDGLVVVRRGMPPLRFPWASFTQAAYRPSWRGWRLLGTGGLFGYFGWYRLAPREGTARVYATTRTHAVVFIGQPSVVVTVADSDALLAAVRRYLPL